MKTLVGVLAVVFVSVMLFTAVSEAAVDTAQYTYYPDGKIASKAAKGAAYTYYPSGRIKTMTLSYADSVGNLFYQYRDENFNNSGIGRVEKTRGRAWSADYQYTMAYLTRKTCYSDTNWTKVAYVLTYYTNTKNTLAEESYVSGMYRGYKDEAWRESFGPSWNYTDHGNLHGRLDRTVKIAVGCGPRNLPDKAQSHKYFYVGNTGRLSTRIGYSDTSWKNIAITHTFYNNANNFVESETMTTPDSAGNNYYHYLNKYAVEIGPQTAVRLYDKTRRQTALNGELSHRYFYFAGTATVSEKRAYSKANWTGLVAIYYYDKKGNLTKKTSQGLAEETQGQINAMDAQGQAEDTSKANQATQTELMQRAGVESQVATPGSKQNGYTVTPSMSNNSLSDNQALVSTAVKKN